MRAGLLKERKEAGRGVNLGCCWKAGIWEVGALTNIEALWIELQRSTFTTLRLLFTAAALPFNFRARGATAVS